MSRQWGKALRCNEDAHHDSVALCCVTAEKAMRTRQTKPSVHDKVGIPWLGVHDKGILSRQRFIYHDKLLTVVKKEKKEKKKKKRKKKEKKEKKKKKKRSPGIGASQHGIRAYVYDYLGLDGHEFTSCIHYAF